MNRLPRLTIVFAVLIASLALGSILQACTSVPQPTPTGLPSPATATLAPTATVTPAAMATTAPTLPTATPKSGSLSAREARPLDWADPALYEQAMRPRFVADVQEFADATRYSIDMTVDIDDLALRGVQNVRYTNQEADPLTEIVFRLLPNLPGYGGSMAVSSATVDGVAADTELRYGNSALYLQLDSPLGPGETVELALTFEGTLPTDPSAGYAQYGYFDGVLALPNAYPMIPVYDDEGWNAELARPYGDATFTDISLYQVRVTVPADMVLAASGVTLERRDNGDGTATHTLVSGPMRDFVLVASADYETASTTVGDVLVTSHYLPGAKDGGEQALDYAAESLRFYEQLIGPYPFTELDVMATPTLAGGIEYPGLVVIAERLYDQQGGFFEFATVHEVAHQWWYSLVGNDQLDDPWLDEALAQYTSLLYYEDRYGDETAQAVLESAFEGPYRRIQENKQDMAVGLPVDAYAEGLYGAVVYGKGPLFFDALRQEVGDEVFQEILRTYFEEHRYGVAYPADLMAVAERTSGQDLDALYDKWILGQ